MRHATPSNMEQGELRAALADLTELTGEPHDWRYVQGIHAQARMASSLDDCPAEHLKRIFQALDTHRRRLRNRAYSYGFVPGKTWKRAVVKIHPEDKIELF